jgi:hypothetical protein
MFMDGPLLLDGCPQGYPGRPELSIEQRLDFAPPFSKNRGNAIDDPREVWA